MTENSSSDENIKLDKKIKNLFDNMSYFQEYNYDIWITFLIIFFTILIVLYYYILNTIKSYRTEWQSEKCNPFLMPFASIINSQNENNDSDFVSTNFTNCLNKMNKSVADKTSTPIFSTFNILGGVFAFIASIASSIMSYILQLFSLLISLFMNFFTKLRDISTETNFIFGSINNFIGNILAFMATIYYQLVVILGSIRIMGPIFAMSIFIGVVIPSIITTSILFLTLIIIIVISWIWILVPAGFIAVPVPIGKIIVGALVIPSLLAFTSSLALTILIILIYLVFVTFSKNTLEKMVSPFI